MFILQTIRREEKERINMNSRLRKSLAFCILSLIVISAASPALIMNVRAQPTHADVWGTGTVDDILKYMAENYDKANKKWIFKENGIATWEEDTEFATSFYDAMNRIEDLRVTASEESTMEKIIGHSDYALLVVKRIAPVFKQKNFQQSVIDVAYQAGYGVAESSVVYNWFSDIAARIEGLTSIDENLWKVNVPARIGFCDKISLKVSYLDVAFWIGEAIMAAYRNNWALDQLQSLDLGDETILPALGKLRALEKDVQLQILAFDIFKPIFSGILSKVAAMITVPVFATLGGVGVAALSTTLGAPPPLAYILGKLGAIGGSILGNWIGDLIGEAVGPYIVDCVREIFADMSVILEQSIRHFDRFWRRAHVKVEILDMWTDGEDNYVPPSIPIIGLPHFDSVFIKLKNTGDVAADFIVSPESSSWTVLESSLFSPIGLIDELIDLIGGALTINSQMVTLQPGQEAIVTFKASPYGLPLGLGWPPLTLYGPERSGFTVWYKSDWFATVAGPIRTGQVLMSSTEETLWTTSGPKFEVKVVSQKEKFVYLQLPIYKSADTTLTLVTVTNTGTKAASFYLGASFRAKDGTGTEHNADLISPDAATLNKGSSQMFTVEWTTPFDIEPGFYEISVNCWKFGPGGIKDYRNRYDDSLSWETMFFVENLIIISPTSSSPAIVGDPSDPIAVYVALEGLPPLPNVPTFSITVGTEAATYQHVDNNLLVFGIYVLKVEAPVQVSEGKYDLEVTATFDSITDSKKESQAVEYTTAPSSEPIEKGLAWLRTRQSGDGSWRGSVGVTSLCVLAFLNAGFDETDNDVSEAIQYLLSKVHGDGSIYVSLPTYETSLALIALVATHNSDYQATIDAARDWLVNSQWDESCIWGSVSKDSWYYGGFGYGWNVRPDLSNSQFALLALDAAELPKHDPLWSKAQVFLHRCQNIEFSITVNIEEEYTVHPFNTQGGYDGGFIYYPGASLAGDQKSYGSMTGAGIWGLLLSGVPKTDERVVAAMNWVKNDYTWDTNPGIGWWRPYYYYLSMSKALTMYGEPVIDGHDWYQELYDKIVGMQTDAGSGQGYWSTSAEDYNPDLTTAYAILSLQTRAAALPVQRLSYLTFILRSNALIRIYDPNGNSVGYNYLTGLGENEVSTAVYSGPFMEPQYVVIINPEAGTYNLELIGVSEGPYTLTIQGNYGEEVTDTFEYTGDIKPAELYGSDVTVTAIVGPLDIYTTPPEFEEVIDNIPPATTLDIGEPKYVDSMDNIYVSPATPFTLTAEDNPGGTGVASTFYRIHNGTYDTGWLHYSEPFYLTDLSDGEYTIDYYSTDNVGNTETTQLINITLFSWNYVFEDTYGRETALKINTAHKFFQFITPDKDYGIREATYMRVRRRTIIIYHKDTELKLITLAVNTKLDFCIAIAWDKQAQKRYFLIDKVGIEE
jgi:squalene-hopene/tetraprenyl-beta-curcumene cyclase